MAIQLVTPRMGEGVEELTLVKWLKNEGDSVKELESIVEVETDKVITELPSPASGVVLKVLAAEGSQIKAGEPLAWIGEPGEDIQASTSSIPTKKKESRPEAKPERKVESQPVVTDSFLSPLVRKMAQENNVDLRQVSGSGKDGRITKNDILKFLESHGAPKFLDESTSTSPSSAPASVTPPGLHPISSIRRTIAERMVNSLRISPHVLTVMEADLSRIQAHRTLNKFLFEQDGVNLTLTAYFISAISSALKANPLVNASWTEDGLIIHPEINIGMAVSLGSEGLIVPVIKNADTLSLLGIARYVNDLANRTRNKKLLPDEVKGGTFTLTNHGMGGSLFAFPIITQPQVGILGTGMMQKRVVVVSDAQGNDVIAIRPMIYLSFVFDHRVLDGEGADTFLMNIKESLENWG